MNDRFRRDTDRLLSGLTWKREDAQAVRSALLGGTPKKAGKLRLGVVFAALFVLTAAAALAIGLSLSPQFTTLQTARRALVDKYDLTMDMVKLFGTKTSEENGRTNVVFSTCKSMFIDPEAVGEYVVEVDKGGKASASWSHDNVDPATWQDGDLTSPVWGAPQLMQALSRYEIYRQWHKDHEDVHGLPMEEQEKLYAELREAVAPLELREGPVTYAAPDAEPVPAVEQGAETAVAAARKALHARYGLTEDMLALFTALPSKEAFQGKDAWTIDFLPVSFDHPGNADWRWLQMLAEKLGSYRVRLSADKGETLEISWSLDNVDYGSAYTQSDWAQAKAYDALILPWTLKLLESNAPIIAKYPEDQTEWFSVEDAAAYDQAFRDAGFDSSRYNHGLPKASDLTAEQAIELAKQAMSAEYGLTPAQMEAYTLTAEYLLDNGGRWDVQFWSADNMGYVSLRASDGEIQMVTLDSGATGNG